MPQQSDCGNYLTFSAAASCAHAPAITRVPVVAYSNPTLAYKQLDPNGAIWGASHDPSGVAVTKLALPFRITGMVNLAPADLLGCDSPYSLQLVQYRASKITYTIRSNEGSGPFTQNVTETQNSSDPATALDGTFNDLKQTQTYSDGNLTIYVEDEAGPYFTPGRLNGQEPICQSYAAKGVLLAVDAEFVFRDYLRIACKGHGQQHAIAMMEFRIDASLSNADTNPTASATFTTTIDSTPVPPGTTEEGPTL